MQLLALDIGSSSVKAATLRAGKVVGRVARVPYETHFDGPSVEVPVERVLGAVATAVRRAGTPARTADLIALSVMSPAWVAIDARGRALTPLVTHQDRRSVEEAAELERRVGKERHLRLAGNRPFPGGISSTTWAWYLRHRPEVLRKADLVGHLSTLMLRQITGARVIDPSNASFTGLYLTTKQGGWSEELCEAVGAREALLPQVTPANSVAGNVTAAAARRFGLMAGTPMLAGIVDTSSAMLLTGARPGQLMNTMGSTDVLGLCTQRALVHEKLLLRALGIGKRWMLVSTIAAAGSSIAWAKEQLFGDYSWTRYERLIRALSRQQGGDASRGVVFEPYLAGDRTSMEQAKGAFSGLILSTTREQMLMAIIESLARASAARLALLRETGATLRRNVVVSGGVQGALERVMHRGWGRGWTFKPEQDATLRGLWNLAQAI